MADSDRLKTRHELYADHRRKVASRRLGSSRNPIVLEDTPPPQAPATTSAKTKNKSGRKLTRDARGRFTKAKAVTKPTSDRKKVAKVTAPRKPKKKARPEKTECLICATTKDTKRKFKAPDDGNTCEHFENVCNSCVQKQIKTKITARQLTDAHLPCMFPGCTTVLDHTALKKVMTTALFETWDTALTKHILAANPSYMACLNPKCGIYFSTENCNDEHQTSITKSKSQSKTTQKQKQKHTQEPPTKAACPYCTHESCLSCNRPWHPGSCNSAKKLEDEESVAAIKKLGAKPCPKCGVNIEKQGGCDHMNCQRCRHNFCWECLGTFTGSTNPHLPTCSHRRPMIGEDIGNFVGENATPEQMNRAIELATAQLRAGRVPVPTVRLPQGVVLVRGAVVRRVNGGGGGV
ncbi:hypothetical protein M3J09_008500 [Ascochyta lentis]